MQVHFESDNNNLKQSFNSDKQLNINLHIICVRYQFLPRYRPSCGPSACRNCILHFLLTVSIKDIIRLFSRLGNSITLVFVPIRLYKNPKRTSLVGLYTRWGKKFRFAISCKGTGKDIAPQLLWNVNKLHVFSRTVYRFRKPPVTSCWTQNFARVSFTPIPGHPFPHKFVLIPILSPQKLDVLYKFQYSTSMTMQYCTTENHSIDQFVKYVAHCMPSSSRSNSASQLPRNAVAGFDYQ